MSVHKILPSNFVSELLSSRYNMEKRAEIITPGLEAVSVVCDLRFL
jgi:hypothetical protein